MRRLASQHERRHPECKVHVVIAQDLPVIGEAKRSAISGAVGEALTNAGKHGAATKITIYAEPADDSFSPAPPKAKDPLLFVSVKDDGSGFDPVTATESIGMSSSIRGRVEEVQGAVEVSSGVGRGTEVQLWV